MKEIKTSYFVETLIAFSSFLIIVGLLFLKIMLAINLVYSQAALTN